MPEKPSIHNLNSQSTKLEKITPCFEVAAKWLEDILHENSHLHYTDLELAVKLDERDPLAVLREEFNLPKHPSIKYYFEGCTLILCFNLLLENGKGEAVYLCGNSLGAAPKRVESILMQDLEVWAKK